jgi:hypothetical protein
MCIAISKVAQPAVGKDFLTYIELLPRCSPSYSEGQQQRKTMQMQCATTSEYCLCCCCQHAHTGTRGVLPAQQVIWVSHTACTTAARAELPAHCATCEASSVQPLQCSAGELPVTARHHCQVITARPSLPVYHLHVACLLCRPSSNGHAWGGGSSGQLLDGRGDDDDDDDDDDEDAPVSGSWPPATAAGAGCAVEGSRGGCGLPGAALLATSQGHSTCCPTAAPQGSSKYLS